MSPQTTFPYETLIYSYTLDSCVILHHLHACVQEHDFGGNLLCPAYLPAGSVRADSKWRGIWYALMQLHESFFNMKVIAWCHPINTSTLHALFNHAGSMYVMSLYFESVSSLSVSSLSHYYRLSPSVAIRICATTTLSVPILLDF